MGQERAKLTVLYVCGRFPCLTETFVWREVVGLRDRGVEVLAASVHPAERRDGEMMGPGAEAVPVYGAGTFALLRDAAGEAFRRPIRTLRTLACAVRDALVERDVSLARRPKVPVQGVAGIALAARVRSRGVDHIHAHMAHVPTTVAMYCAMQLGIAFSFTGHAVELFPQRTLLRAKLRRARFVACISRWHRELYQSIEPLSDERLPLVRCGVDCRSNGHGGGGEGGRSGFTILTVGRLVPKKGMDILIRAIGLLEGRAQVRCLVVGDGPERTELEALAGRLGVGPIVEFLGPAPNARVQELMTASDLFVLPCRVGPDGDRDGIPVVLMEAMAHGVCVVAGDLPAIRELVEDGRTGVLAIPEPGAIAAAIGDLMDDPGRRAALGAAGREHVRAEFSLATNLDRMARALGAAG